MSGGNQKARFIQEFPFAQYGALFLSHSTGMSIRNSGQFVATLIALLSILVIAIYCNSLPEPWPLRLILASIIIFIPGFLRYAPTAVPDSTVFLLNVAGAATIFLGRRRASERLIALGAALVGFTVLAKVTALIPALAVAAALVYEKRRVAVLALALATLPGLAWTVLCVKINPAAAPVNEWARQVSVVSFWNPSLYLDPWWFRNMLFLHYDTLGLVGLSAIALVVTTALRNRQIFELTIFLLPMTMMALVFNYHSASHGYYHLVWLPLSLIAGLNVFCGIQQASKYGSHERN
jgi:hypothetical protein